MLSGRWPRIHLARQHVDFRKSIDGLSGEVRRVLDDDPTSGHVFVFHNRRCTALKLLWWDHGGFCMLYKRLERGRFRLPGIDEVQRSVKLTPAELQALMEGLELVKTRRVKVWNPREFA